MTDLDTWTRHLADALGLPATDMEKTAVLDLARVAAHGVARPAAPLTTFLAGYAAGLRGGGPDVISDVIATTAAEIDLLEDTDTDVGTDVGTDTDLGTESGDTPPES